jgi:peptide deformylase
MKQFQIVQFPDPILRRVCEPVDQMDVRVRKFIGRLHQVMKRQPGGVGIAAPQLGVMRQIAVANLRQSQSS